MVTVPLTQLITALLVVLLASALGTVAWLAVGAWTKRAWMAIFAMLFIFGAVLLLVKVT